MSVVRVNPVAEQANWRQRVRSELNTIETWADHWGFLATVPAGHDSLDAYKAQNLAQKTKSLIALTQKEDIRARVENPGDSLDSFVLLNLKRQNGRDMRLPPKSEFSRPLLTSHAYGWGNSLERFGKLTLRLR